MDTVPTYVLYNVPYLNILKNICFFSTEDNASAARQEPFMSPVSESSSLHKPNFDQMATQKKRLGKGTTSEKAAQKSIHCTQCQRSFSRPCRLRDHMMIHMGEKPYCCFQCPKTFCTPDGMKMHVRTHTGEKPYSCSYCSKSFSSSGNRKLHLRTHTGEKPFSCSLCHKSFSQAGTLKGHLKMHTS